MGRWVQLWDNDATLKSQLPVSWIKLARWPPGMIHLPRESQFLGDLNSSYHLVVLPIGQSVR